MPRLPSRRTLHAKTAATQGRVDTRMPIILESSRTCCTRRCFPSHATFADRCDLLPSLSHETDARKVADALVIPVGGACELQIRKSLLPTSSFGEHATDSATSKQCVAGIVVNRANLDVVSIQAARTMMVHNTLRYCESISVDSIPRRYEAGCTKPRPCHKAIFRTNQASK